MSTLAATNLKNASSGSNNIVLATDGSATIATLSSTTITGTTITGTTITGTTIQGTIQSGTSVASTSGTSIDFTSIPSWVKRITVMFDGVSSSGTSNYLIQLGDSGGIETTGYLSYSCRFGTASMAGGANYTTGFGIASNVATYVHSGSAIISLLGSNTWCVNGFFAESSSAVGVPISGRKSVSDTLTQIRITTVNGTDTFDAGTINILYEG